MKNIAIFTVVCLVSGGIHAKLSLPWLFADHMVVQQGMPVPVWGDSAPGAQVTVSFAGQKVSSAVGKDGKWIVRLPPMSASSSPREMSIAVNGSSGVESLTIRDVLIGELWLAAGQSNMWFPLKSCSGGKEAVAAAGNKNIRLLNRVPNAYPNRGAWSDTTLEMCTVEKYCSGSWTKDSPESAAPFSGVAYWFGLKLQHELNVPVGIINISVGGTTTEAYTSREGLLSNALLKPVIASDSPWYDNEHVAEWPRGRAKDNLSRWIADPVTPMPHHPFEPAFLFESAVRPLVPMAFAGVIWYQGESNATDASNKIPVPAKIVRAGFETMIRDWRDHWKRKFPFLYVQLPGMDRPWEIFREVQLECLDIPDTGMAVSIDLGDPRDVHPRNKQPVGERLALLALSLNYGRNIACSGPLFKGSFKLSGSDMIVFFDHCDKGLKTQDGKEVRGFEIAGADCVFHKASAELRENSVVLSSDFVKKPVMARYGWAPFPDCNVVNSAGLPMSPFRTHKHSAGNSKPDFQ